MPKPSDPPQAAEDVGLSEELAALLAEIERESVPDRLLAAATRLQEALRALATARAEDQARERPEATAALPSAPPAG